MSWDIYGEPLRRGHCEVHPHVHEEYPCSVCIADNRTSEQQGVCKGGCESEHLLHLAREHIEYLEKEKRDAFTSLARLKAQWQAEALQELYNTWKGEGMMRVGALLDKAIELQEEAER